MFYAFRVFAIVTCALAVSTADAADQPEKAVVKKPWAKSDGNFGAMMLFSDQPDEFLAAWGKPGDGVRLRSTEKAERGVPIVTFIVFAGCAPDDHGLCQATVTFATYRPDGKPYGEALEGELWVDEQPPGKGQIQLGASNMGVVLEPEDPLGVYKVQATVVDKVADKKLILEREFTAVESRGEEGK